MAATVRAISGVGGKGPACFLVQAAGHAPAARLRRRAG